MPEGRGAGQQRVHDDPRAPPGTGGAAEGGRWAGCSAHPYSPFPSLVLPVRGAPLSLRVTSLLPAHSHVHLLPVAGVVIVHGALDDLRGQVTGGPTDLCRDSFHRGRSAEAHGRERPTESRRGTEVVWPDWDSEHGPRLRAKSRPGCWLLWPPTWPVSGLVIGASTGLEHRQWEPGSAQSWEETASLEMVGIFILGGKNIPGSPCSQES